MRIGIGIDCIVKKNYEPDEDIITSMKLLRDKGHEIYIINDRGDALLKIINSDLKANGLLEPYSITRDEMSLRHKVNTILNTKGGFLDTVNKAMIIDTNSRSKAEICGIHNLDVMIDTSAESQTEVELEGIKAVILDREENKGKASNLSRVSSFLGFLSFIIKYEDEKKSGKMTNYSCREIFAVKGEPLDIDDFYKDGKPRIPWNKIEDTGQSIVVGNFGLKKPIVNAIKSLYVSQVIMDCFNNHGIILKIPFPTRAREPITNSHFDTVYIGENEVRMSTKDGDLRYFVITSDRMTSLSKNKLNDYEIDNSNTGFSLRISQYKAAENEPNKSAVKKIGSRFKK